MASSGKLSVRPVLTPKLDEQRHWRDYCAVVRFSMAGEAVFAFNIAVHGDTHGLMETEVYPSVVLAILLSTANYISANDACTLSVQ